MAPSSVSVYFENAAGRLIEYPEGYVAFMCFAGKRQLTDLQALLTHMGLSLQHHHWHKMLWDQCAMAPFTHEESLWIADYWLYLSKRRLKGLTVAVVQASDVYARLSMNLFLSEAREANLVFRLFEEGSQAAAWLRQVA
jgi:hypothetical protein